MNKSTPIQYRSESENYPLRALNDNYIMDGLDLEVSTSNKKAIVTINPGLAVADRDLLVFDSIIRLEMYIANLDPSGTLIVTILYDHLTKENPRLKLIYISPNGAIILPIEEGFGDKDRIILGKIKFSMNSAGNITSIINDTAPRNYLESFDLTGIETINIQGVNCPIQPFDFITMRAAHLILGSGI